MEGIDYWRFCDELTVLQATLLIVDEDPGLIGEYVAGWRPQDRPDGYIAVLSALQHSIIGDRLPAKKVNLNLDYQHPDFEHPIDSVDWRSTRVQLSDLKSWLQQRGVQTGFFFPQGPVAAEYLDPENDCYAPKLAAAVNAWEAVRSDRTLKPSARSVKQDLTRWLNLHAAEYSLTNDEGEPNKQAVEEVAKVANWNSKGGAPRTPGDRVSEANDKSDLPF